MGDQTKSLQPEYGISAYKYWETTTTWCEVQHGHPNTGQQNMNSKHFKLICTLQILCKFFSDPHPVRCEATVVRMQIRISAWPQRPTKLDNLDVFCFIKYLMFKLQLQRICRVTFGCLNQSGVGLTATRLFLESLPFSVKKNLQTNIPGRENLLIKTLFILL